MIKLLYIFLIPSLLLAEGRGWVHPETGWEISTGTHMCIFMLDDVFINNQYAEHEHSDAIGIFFEDQCIGWEYYQNNIIIPTIGDDGENPQFPIDGDLISIYIYDNSEGVILNLQSLEPIPTWSLGAWQNISNLYACEYNAPIQQDGTCPTSCSLDPNLDGNIDLLDIIYLIDMILYCNDCEISCGDIIDDNQIDIHDIMAILEIILDD